VARDLQEMMGQRPQQCFLVPLLVGTDGKMKMSKSLGNYIALEDPPQEMYGKVMSLPDDVMMDYYELVTDVPDKELAEIGEALRTRAVNPMELKMRLAREIVAQFHSDEAAQAAEEEFTRVFRERELPEEVPIEVPFHFKGESEAEAGIDLLVMQHCGLSRREVKRLIRQGAIEVDGIPVTDPLDCPRVRPGSIIRVGKRRFLRIVDADKQ
jgi:tyrosyl-tRNA synthetase